MAAKVVKKVSSSLEKLGDIRAFVRLHCQYLKLEEQSTIQLELAVNEIASNIVKHAYQEREDQPIEMELSSTGYCVAIRLFHWGKAFAPDRVQPPTFDGSRDHGFGLYIVDQCVDKVTYTTQNGRNCIELIKKIPQSHKEEH